MQVNKEQRIFIVDDDPFWSSLLSGMLRQLNVEDVHVFDKPSECLLHISLNPSIIFLDYQMDEVDGLQFLQQLKVFLPETNVIFCTSHNNIRLAVAAIKNGAYDYIYKSACRPEEIESLLIEIAYGPDPASRLA